MEKSKPFIGKLFENNFELIEWSDINEFIIETNDNKEIILDLKKMVYFIWNATFSFSNFQDIDDILTINNINISDIKSIKFPSNTIETDSNIRRFLAKYSNKFYIELFKIQAKKKIDKLIDSWDWVY